MCGLDTWPRPRHPSISGALLKNGVERPPHFNPQFGIRPPQPWFLSRVDLIQVQRCSADATPPRHISCTAYKQAGGLSSANSIPHISIPAAESGNSKASRNRFRLSGGGGLLLKNFG